MTDNCPLNKQTNKQAISPGQLRVLEVLFPVRPVRVLHDVLLPAEVGDEVLLLLPGHPKLSLDLVKKKFG